MKRGIIGESGMKDVGIGLLVSLRVKNNGGIGRFMRRLMRENVDMGKGFDVFVYGRFS